MKKLLIRIMALAIILSLAACRGSDSAPATSPSTPVQVEEVEFTAEQQALAEDFISMASMLSSVPSFFACS